MRDRISKVCICFFRSQKLSILLGKQWRSQYEIALRAFGIKL